MVPHVSSLTGEERRGGYRLVLRVFTQTVRLHLKPAGESSRWYDKRELEPEQIEMEE